MFQSARQAPDSALARIDDDRKILHRSLHKVLRTMSCVGVKEQCIARLNQVSAIGMAIPNLAGQHVDDFDAGVAELSVGNCVFGKINQIRLNANLAGQRMSQEVVLVPRLSAAAFYPHAATCLNE